MAFKATITEASDLEINGNQVVTFEISNAADKVLAKQQISGDVNDLTAEIVRITAEFELKFKSAKRLKVGDVIEV